MFLFCFYYYLDIYIYTICIYLLKYTLYVYRITYCETIVFYMETYKCIDLYKNLVVSAISMCNQFFYFTFQ